MSANFSDLISGLPDLPLSATAKAYQKEILSIPHTAKPMDGFQPEGIDPDEVDRLHDLALNAPKRAVRPLLDCIKRFPDYPTLQNYLVVAYEGSGRRRQAREVRNQLLKNHPDYLFGRYGFAIEELAAGNIDKAEEIIGKGLNIRKVYPEREIFHISEMRTFYVVVGIIHARRGELELAYGVHGALKVFDRNSEAREMVKREILLANLKRMKDRAEKDKRRRITVSVPELARKSATNGPPVFQYELIESLYENDIDLPMETIHEILALPRKSLVEDLMKVLDDCVDRTPHFIKLEENSRSTCALFHALYLLAELKAVEALPSLLRVLSLHPDAIDFWLGETSAHSPQVSRLVGDGIPDCVAWLKQPGLAPRNRGMLCEGLEFLARQDESRRDEVVAALMDVLAFLLASPREDNVLDTRFLALLICGLVSLRAENALPLIETAYGMNLVEEGFVGDLDSVKMDITGPFDPIENYRDIEAEYRYWQNGGMEESDEEAFEDEPDNLVRPRFEDPSWSPFADEVDTAPEPGRNDLCPCGSGKKYKKCCIT